MATHPLGRTYPAMSTKSIKRRLATILAADAVSYSRLMEADEEGTARALSSHFAEMMSLVAEHDGRVFNTAGDALFAVFDSPVEAMRAAIAIQATVDSANAAVEPARRMAFRIGLHLGDVMIDGDDLLGDGVNVAARLEGLAAPGGIALSATVYDQVAGKLPIDFACRGAREIKNIAKPVTVYRVAAD